MFSLQIKTIFRVLGEALLALANMPASAADTLDRPDIGADLVYPKTEATFVDAVISNAATVFAPPASEAATVFAAPEPTIYEMAAGYPYTREQMNTAGWSDDALIAAGHLVAVAPPKPIDPPVTAPPPPPAPVAPPPPSATPVAPPPTAPSGAPSASANALVDSAGVIYDARIHAQTQTKTADGQWKKGRGVAPELIAQVLAKQKGGVVAPAPAPFVPLNAAPPPPAPGVTASVSAPVTAPPPPPAAGAAAPTTAPTTFVELCVWNNAKKIAKPRLDEVCNALGVPGGFPGLARPENAQMIPNVVAMLQSKV